MLNILQALPLTNLMARLEKEGRIPKKGEHANMHNSRLCNFIPTRPLQEIALETLNCHWQLYEPHNFMKRAYDHCMNMGIGIRRKASKKFNIKQSRELLAFAVLVWRQGIKRQDSRVLFWAYCWKILKNKPIVLRSFVVMCAHYEHFYQYREIQRKDILSQLAKLTEEEKNRIAVFAASHGKIGNRELPEAVAS